MRRIVWVVLLLLAVECVAIDAQHRLRRLRRAPAIVVDVGETLSQSDFTDPKGFRAPASVTTSWGDTIQPYYGEGLTLKYESGDSNNLHFISMGYATPYNAMTCADCNLFTIYQMRVPTESLPGSPLTYSNWTAASTTGQKTYSGPTVGGNAGYGIKRLVYYPTAPSTAAMQNHLTGKYGVFYDSVDDRLYQTYHFGYTTECDDWSLLYTTLNYASPSSSTSAGPWGFSSAAMKSVSGWIGRLPDAFVTAYTPGKPLVIGSGASTSQVAVCDVSLGTSAVAFAAPSGSEQTDLTSTPLVGYWPQSATPGAGKGRMTRATAISFGDGFDFYSDEAWGATKQTQFDYIEGCAVVDTGTKSGLVCINRTGEGICNYANGTLPCQYYRDYIVVYSLADLALVASGSSNRYDIQPTAQWEVQWPQINYSLMPHAKVAVATISSINGSSSSGATVQYQTTPSVDCALDDGGGAGGTHPLVTTSAAHGLSVGNYASIEGTNQDGEYSNNWVVCEVPSATTFRFGNTSDPTGTFAGISATGGTVYTADGPRSNSSGPTGVAYNPTTKRIHFGIKSFQVASGQPATYFVNSFQLP